MVGEAPFDLEAAVAELLADPHRSSLDLPQMTNGQRKQARKYIEEHSGLTCENVGLGAERRLRVLKLGQGGPDQEDEEAQSREVASCESSMSGTKSDESFDIDVAISEFLADARRRSLELPHMTTGQRKQARKLVDKHPELKCESYGLGAERRLHLFKPEIEKDEEAPAEVKHLGHLSPSSLVAHVFSVKNTFIDGFAEEPQEPTVFRSTPVRLPGGVLPRRRSEPCEPFDETCSDATEGRSGEPVEGGKADESSEGRGCCHAEHDTPGDVSPVGSTTASQSSTALPSGRGGEATPHTLPEGLRIRNTFICGSLGESLDTRTVRSMPHGMFKQCLLEERAALEVPLAGPVAGLALAAAPEDVGAGMPLAEMTILVPGTEVIIQGLTKLPEFNGLAGTVQCLDETVGRYDILLPAPVGATGQRWAKVKRENLSVAVQPQPPCHPPSLLPVPESYREASPLQLPSVLPAVDRAQYAALHHLATDFGSHCNLGAPPAPYGTGEWSWYGMESFPSWGEVPSMPVPV